MSKELAIEVNNLGKRYQIGVARERYPTVRDAITRTVTAPYRAIRSRMSSSRGSEKSENTFWALRDVSFEVKPGEVVGVIGRNGAGKSTLLKVLSRITEPTLGRVRIRGRVGSLLEVGTGFHMELTGRENVYLNGAILGMSRREIDRKFDEIVDFSDVEKFIDTPVKHYSSGMHLRLAFAVAAHLEPEILLVDEVLAVGDAVFQKKCLGKMGSVASDGRTILFVSHNLAAVRELCETAVVLSQGGVQFRGSVSEALAVYTRNLLDTRETTTQATGFNFAKINGQPSGVPITINSADPFWAEVRLSLREELIEGRLFCEIEDASGNLIVHRRIFVRELAALPLLPNDYHVRVEFPALWLAPGAYGMTFKFIGTTAEGGAVRFTSEHIALDVNGNSIGLGGRAILAPELAWQFTSVSSETSDRTPVLASPSTAAP